MKNIFTAFSLLFYTFISGAIYPQVVDYENLQSVVFPPPGFQNGPNGTISKFEVVNGFDNFFLGVDFGETYIATNPRNPLNSICAYNTNNLYYTLNGYTWISNNPPFGGYGILGDPVMCYDSIGTAYYIQLYQNANVYGLAVVKSTNNGVSWSPAYNVASTTVGLSDKEWIEADQTGGPYSNYVYAGWRQFGSTGMRFVRSTNGGVNWSQPISLAGGQGAYVSVGPNGNIQGGSVYFACASNGIVIYRSTDGGLSFSNPVLAVSNIPPGIICAGRYTVKNCIRTDDFPRMAADNGYTATRGYVYIVYAGNPPGPDIADVYLVRSTNYGVNWSSPVRVNDDATTTDQWMPSVSVDRNGKIFICWYDSRMDQANNKMTQLYGTTSTNGGLSFTPNSAISDVPFDPDRMAVGQPGGHRYMGDYIGISAIGNFSYASWMDGRNSNLSSYTAFYPDFALTINPVSPNLVNNDSVNITVKVPALKGPFSGNVRFSASLDTLPASGTINFSFLNGRDSITSYPDSVILKVKTIGNVTPKLYRLNVIGRGTSGVPVHSRIVNLLINTSFVTVRTNRSEAVEFKVNGVTYNSPQQFVFANLSQVTVQAISPKVIGLSRFVFLNWSDNGDTTHTITVNGNITLTANYKVQYKIVLNSIVGNSFGGNEFYDSAQTFTFGVLSRNVIYNGNNYQFRGWTGTGNGSYTSPDSTGNDTAVSISMSNAIVEYARWSGPPIGIQNLGSELPKEYRLSQNYPNPFNPSTAIEFDIIKGGNVRIVLYDLVGREVGTIVNENLEPGKYKVSFTADNLASGLYFYKIVSNSFVDVKKMLILK